MEKERRPQFKIIYINEIGFGNRINRKAYLSCMEDESFYYVFPSCSDSFNSDIRYENQKVFIKGNKSHGNHLFDLRRLIQLPKDRTSICSFHIILGEEYINEIIKKVKDCSRYIDYPNKVMDFFKRQSSSISIDDLVIFNENTYVIRGFKGKSLVGSRAFPYPADGTCYEVVDCQELYVDTSRIEELAQITIDTLKEMQKERDRKGSEGSATKSSGDGAKASSGENVQGATVAQPAGKSR